MKSTIITICGIVGGFIAALLGGWTMALQALIIFMAIDFVTGFFVAGVFKKSKKTKTGALSSNEGFKGLCKKIVILLMVTIAYQLDLLAGTTFLRDAVIIGYCVNELVSITENLGLMGIPVPQKLRQAIDALQEKDGDKND